LYVSQAQRQRDDSVVGVPAFAAVVHSAGGRRAPEEAVLFAAGDTVDIMQQQRHLHTTQAHSADVKSTQ
jgi:hypothetical protein